MNLNFVSELLKEIAFEEMAYKEMDRKRAERIKSLSNEQGIKIVYNLVRTLGLEQKIDQECTNVTAKLYSRRISNDRNTLEQMKTLYKLECLANLHDKLSQIVSRHLTTQFKQGQHQFDDKTQQSVIKGRNSVPLEQVYQFINQHGQALKPYIENGFKVFFQNLENQESQNQSKEKVEAYTDVNQNLDQIEGNNSYNTYALRMSKELSAQLAKTSRNKEVSNRRVEAFKQLVSSVASQGLAGYTPENIRKAYQNVLNKIKKKQL